MIEILRYISVAKSILFSKEEKSKIGLIFSITVLACYTFFSVNTLTKKIKKLEVENKTIKTMPAIVSALNSKIRNEKILGGTYYINALNDKKTFFFQDISYFDTKAKTPKSFIDTIVKWELKEDRPIKMFNDYFSFYYPLLQKNNVICFSLHLKPKMINIINKEYAYACEFGNYFGVIIFENLHIDAALVQDKMADFVVIFD